LNFQAAEYFEKEHKDVLKAISNLECSPEFTERNFALSKYTDSTGRKCPRRGQPRSGGGRPFSFCFCSPPPAPLVPPAGAEGESCLSDFLASELGKKHDRRFAWRAF